MGNGSYGDGLPAFGSLTPTAPAVVAEDNPYYLQMGGTTEQQQQPGVGEDGYLISLASPSSPTVVGR